MHIGPDTIAQVLNAICVMCTVESVADCEKCTAFFFSNLVCLLRSAHANANVRCVFIFEANAALVIRSGHSTHSLYGLPNFNSVCAIQIYSCCSTFIQPYISLVHSFPISVHLSNIHIALAMHATLWAVTISSIFFSLVISIRIFHALYFHCARQSNARRMSATFSTFRLNKNKNRKCQ